MRTVASLCLSKATMKFIQCSMCRRAAAWLIDKEVFCEGHKEMIIETFGVDRFPIRRLTNEDEAFAVGGHFRKPNPIKKRGDQAF
jgi:hypothetical protein